MERWVRDFDSWAVHDKQAGNESFEWMLRAVKKGAKDERNIAKKAVSWALRQIGERSQVLHGLTIRAVQEPLLLDLPSARWVVSAARRILRDARVW